MNNTREEERDHLFISYATEDIAVAEWLTYRLTALGYKVWCDRIKLLGGESYPEDIDRAIKDRTFRFLALLSRASLEKPNPRKERTSAHNIARERHINFIIPINLGLRPTELDWMTSDLTYIDFSRNWAEGFIELLKALQEAGSPCPLARGGDIVSDSVISKDIFGSGEETVYSNLLMVRSIPKAISLARFPKSLTLQEEDALRRRWPCRKISHNTFLSFDVPPKDLPHNIEDAYQWETKDKILGMDARDLVSALLRKSLACHCTAKGLTWSPDRKWLYFPFDLLKSNRVEWHCRRQAVRSPGFMFFAVRRGVALAVVA